MKKVYITLILVFFVLASFAQKRTIRLEVTLTAPAPGATIEKGTTFEQKFVIKNLGPGAIKPADTVLYRDPAAPAGSAFLRMGYTKAVGDTIQINRSGYSFPASTATGPTNYCVTAAILNSVDTVRFDTTGGTYRDCNMVTITAPVSVDEVFTAEAPEGQLGITPNPASTEVSFDFVSKNSEGVSVHVYDLTGRIVLSHHYGASIAGQEVFTLNISSLHSGVYFVELRQQDYRFTGKLYKQ